MDIIKTIFEYPPIVAPETLKEWKVAITSVEQGYESTESQHNYKMGTGTIFRGKEAPIVKIEESRLDLFSFLFIFIFLFNLFFYFLFLEQLGLGLIGHTVTSVTW